MRKRITIGLLVTVLLFSGCAAVKEPAVERTEETASAASAETESETRSEAETSSAESESTETTTEETEEGTTGETTAETTEETTAETTEETTEETVSLPELRDPDHVINTDTTLYSYEMMEEDLHYLAAVHPELMTLESMGQTADGRELYTVYFGNREADRQIFICAATHAREYMTPQLVMKQLEFYAAHYYDESYNGVSFSEIFEKTCFVIMPMINPDGVSISQYGEAGVRNPELLEKIRGMFETDVNGGYTDELDYSRYLVRWKANARGVDINRNFSPGWDTIFERPGPSSGMYKGEAPGDQAESQALMALIDSLSNPLAVISYHSYGDLVYYQYGQQGEMYEKNELLAQRISALTGHYLAGYSNEAGFANWCVLERGIPAVVVETGTVPTPLPLDQFPDLWERHRYMWAMLGTSY